jgi:hypothetical protein
MARYNSVNTISSVAGGSAITTPSSGLLTTLTGAGTVNLPNPVLYAGSTQIFYNSTATAITLSTATGQISGPGVTSASTLSLPSGSILTLISDGSNYITQGWLGGVISATSGAINGVSVGATTASTGAFTTLNVGSTTTLAGGSASGVFSFTSPQASSATNNGAIIVAGGAGIGGNLYVGGSSYVVNAANPTRWVSVDTALTTQSMYMQVNTTSNDTRIGSYTNHPLGIYTNNSERLRVNTSGQLLVNITNIPTYVSNTTGTTVINAGVGTGDTGQLAIIGNNGAAAELLISGGNGGTNRRAGIRFYSQQYSSTPAWSMGASFGQTTGDGSFYFYNNANANVLTFTQAGNISIGSTTAAVSLDLSTRTDAIFLPVGTDGQRPGTPSAGMQRYNSTRAAIEYYDGTAWRQVTQGLYVIDYLIVAGGGSGGGGQVSLGGGGGGGAGGLIYGSLTVSTSNTFSFIIGSGGAAPAVNSLAHGNSGGNTTAFGQTAIGGGGGGYGASASSGYSGGSGGGGGYNGYSSAGNGGSGTAGQGNSGGGVSGVSASGGGGGGYSSAGSSNTGSGGGSGGLGGSGYVWLDGNTYAVGGQGGGAAVNSDATNGTGNGSPGAYAAAQTWRGGDGVVIVRYIGGTKGSGGTISSAGGYTYHKFTGSGTFTA